MKNEKLHAETKRLAQELGRAETELFKALSKVQQLEAYRDFGFKGLFTYAVQHLGLTESVAQMYRTLVNHALELPALKTALETEALSMARAARVVSNLNADNVDEILDYAMKHSVRETERWLHAEKGAAQKFKIEIDGETRELLRTVKDFSPGNMSDNEVLKWALQELRKRHDPIEKAKRAATSKTKSAEQKSETLKQQTNTPKPKTNPLGRALPAESVHATNLRDGRRCCHRNAKGERCTNTRWTQKHHIHPFSEGGGHEPENIITLCPEHHDLVHQLQFPLDEQRGWISSPPFHPLNVQ